MLVAIPDKDRQLAKLALQQHFVSSEQMRTVVGIYRRYQATGGELPTLGRILVARHLLTLRKAEKLLRHIWMGEPLPPPEVVGLSRHSLSDSSMALGLEPPDTSVHLHVSGVMPANEHEELIRGLGATVLRKELQNIKGYEITEVLGEGSMGITYKAHQISMDRTVALKVLPPEKTSDPRFVKEFLAEARNTGRLNHPNLIRVHEVSHQGGTFFYSMEYVDALRLDEMMDECEGGKLNVKDAVHIFIQIANALDYGFRCGVIHREIRPDTIMVSEDRQAKLAELGLAKDENTRFLEGENACYVAPEQIQGGNVDTRTDIYSLGCCLFHCLTGEPPMHGGGPREVLHRCLVAPAPNPRDFNPQIPVPLASIIMRMMARDPKNRFQTPLEVAEALKTVTFAPTSAPAPKPVKKFHLKRRTRYGAKGGVKRPLRRRYR
jgi:serine/threonine-protein kinase